MSKISRRQQQKFKKLLQDVRQDCIVFSNVFHKDCFSDRLDGETNDQWNTRYNTSNICAICPHVHTSVPMFIRLSPCSYVCPHVHMSVPMFICLSPCSYVCSYVCLSMYQSLSVLYMYRM